MIIRVRETAAAMPSEAMNGDKETAGDMASAASEEDDGFFTSAVSVQHKVRRKYSFLHRLYCHAIMRLIGWYSHKES